MWTRPCSLTVTVRADFWPGTLVGLSRSLRGLPEDTGVSGPGGHTAATQVEAPFSQTDERIRHYGGKNIKNLQRGGLKQRFGHFWGPDWLTTQLVILLLLLMIIIIIIIVVINPHSDWPIRPARQCLVRQMAIPTLNVAPAI